MHFTFGSLEDSLHPLKLGYPHCGFLRGGINTFPAWIAQWNQTINTILDPTVHRFSHVPQKPGGTKI